MENIRKILRWLTLAAILFNIWFNYAYQTLPKASSISVVSLKYSSLFSPAGYAFSIWGLIYLSFIIYGIAQLLPKVKYNVTYSRLALPLLLANVLASVWVYVFSRDLIALSLVLSISMLLAGIYMFTTAQTCYRSGWAPARLLVPFSLFVGWMSVAVIANVAIYLRSIGWNGFGQSDEFWAIVMVIVATLLGIAFSTFMRNYIVPAVITWALIAIYVGERANFQTVANAALIAGIVTAVSALVALVMPMLYNKERKGVGA